MVLTAWAVGPLEFDLTKALPLEKDPDPSVAVIREKQRLPWRQVQADISGKGFDRRSVLGREPASQFGGFVGGMRMKCSHRGVGGMVFGSHFLHGTVGAACVASVSSFASCGGSPITIR